ncbi:hypothetical protein [Mucilaginibacter ginsenosidivorans]|uniref:TerB family tellurite resistance protein n=1 Tax=Mucilaginibacter ginsenosidivorans TaxID=398053 RepID=A0A5B8UU03_9SPHI|nr:hypothetical protein [Mucilaginibacter ginsenosidivorans]QEC61916.1 hypothetical protein FRZ54_04725 [Mucilaginibacter ginsenosidivorans]
MRKYLSIFLVLVSAWAHGQGIGSFFSQQSTKKKDMALQIALMETYLSGLKHGYMQTQDGLANIHDLKSGSFSLNNNYFLSLSQVSPAVRQNPKVAEIQSLAAEIKSNFRRFIQWQHGQDLVTAGDISYLQKVADHLIAECDKELVMLADVISPGKFQLADVDRIKEINSIDADMKDKYAFCLTFIDRTRNVTLRRQAEARQQKILKRLYNLQ